MSTPRAVNLSLGIAIAALAALLGGCNPAFRPAAPQAADAVASPSAPHDTGAAVVRAPTPPATPTGRRADFRRLRLSKDAREIAEWVVGSGDNRDLPFIIVDKANARVIAFDAAGRLHGARRRCSVWRAATTRCRASASADCRHPAGGAHHPGRPLRSGDGSERQRRGHPLGRLRRRHLDAPRAHLNPAERRLQRLATPSIADNRISYGCINLPAAFYDEVVKPLFSAHNGIVYVLPETRPAREVFGVVNVARSATPSSLR